MDRHLQRQINKRLKCFCQSRNGPLCAQVPALGYDDDDDDDDNDDDDDDNDDDDDDDDGDSRRDQPDKPKRF